MTSRLSALLFSCLFAYAADDAPARLLTQAQLQLAAGRYQEVLKTAAEAGDLFRKAGDRTGEGRALNMLGLAQLYSGAYAPALGNFTTALAIAREKKDASSEIVRLNNIGNVHYYQGHYSEALARYQEARHRVGSSPNQPWTVARRQLTLANIAILYQTLGQYERALDIYNDLLRNPQALPPSEHAQLLSNVGTLRRRLGDPHKALSTYREAQSLYRAAANRDGELAVLNNIGIVQARDLADLGGAVSTFTTSLQLAESSGSKPMAIHARLYRGEAFYRTGRIDDSRFDFQTAANDAASLGQLEENWKALYGLARIDAGQGQTAECDALLKRAIDLIESLRAALKQTSLRSDFLADKRDVYDLLIEHTSDPAELFRLMEQSRARVLRDRVRATAIAPLSEFVRSLPADTLLLEYWAGKSSIKVLSISNGGAKLKMSTMTPEVSALSSILADPAQRNWRRMAAEASQQLLPLIEEGSVKHLVIIPDEALARIPFEALPIGSQLLIERFSVSYLPSASLMIPPAKHPLRWPWQPALEAFADPAADNHDGERTWAPLPESAREVSGIARILTGRAAVHLGPEASKDRLTGPAHAPILHFATHAFVDLNDPARSYILLAKASLYLNEVEQLPLSGVDLAVASACETDAGKVVRGEGVQSFSRAFLAAGARSVVTSLWAVGDRSTADLMLGFYSQLEKGLPKAEALRAAKLEVLNQGAHPAQWAAFVLDGEGRAPIPYVVSWKALLAPLLLLAAAFAWIRKPAGKA